jgi:L-ascorbate metabolism protein UlaG (beta-lactamase superfamily)
MNRRTFSKAVLSLSALPLLSSTKEIYTIRLLRHATVIIQKGKTRFLVDPMLSPKGAMDPVGNAGNDIRIPMVDLPVNNDELVAILKDVDAVLVTHTHRDHWDAAAQQMIDKSKPVFCQPTDLDKIKSQGFTNVKAIGEEDEFKGITIYRTGGQHGSGEIAQRMGTVSGFVLEEGDDRLYIAGDTIWCSEVEEVLKKFKPKTTVVNAGGAQFLTGDPITMTAEDVARVAATDRGMLTVPVHMDTINHCKVTRAILSERLGQLKKEGWISIPYDGGKI